MKTGLPKILLRIHLIALVIAILNSLLKNLTAYSLEGNFEFGIELLTAVSGFTLFFFYLKPFKSITYYFSIYATVVLLLIIGLIFRGLFWALLLSVLLFPIIPDDKQFEENGIIISTPFQGFMARCCSYQIKERKLLIFEKNYGIFTSEEGSIDFKTIKIDSTEKEILLTYSTDFESEIKTRKIKRQDS